MKNCKQIDIDLKEIVEIFNRSGKTAATEFAKQKYGVNYYLIARRIKSETNYRFNKGTRKYELSEHNDNQFLTLDQLCKTNPVAVEKTQVFPQIQTISFETILVDLMKDRLVEISKYIQLDPSCKKITINIENLKKTGYEVVLY